MIKQTQTTAMIGIPKTEKIWVTYTTQSGITYLITSKESDRSCYFIYKLTDSKAVKLGRSPSPKELEKKYIK